ncbi:hypothetical protein GIB67_015462 [Kingdonia uniflora]|uniref:Uncharacterized protein n=1 Tax=Kingdonia uniflora TaxID=39325 RepID=A0A7J7KZ31_9MAGN|nr:hypothetical protein GIB67_015462 [Kingdonia uniflora]
MSIEGPERKQRKPDHSHLGPARNQDSFALLARLLAQSDAKGFLAGARTRQLTRLVAFVKIFYHVIDDFTNCRLGTVNCHLFLFKGMDPSMTGRDAKPIYRDKEGKRTTKEELQKSQGEEKPKEKKLEWGQGLAQKREVEAREQELELEKDKPFARTRGFPIDLLRIVEEGLSGKFHFRDDPELENMLKERVRWGDPMAHLVKRKHSELLLEDLGDNEKMKESGFNIPQEIPFHSWINRKVDAPPNRYAIKPGRHWDGIDRSNVVVLVELRQKSIR